MIDLNSERTDFEQSSQNVISSSHILHKTQVPTDDLQIGLDAVFGMCAQCTGQLEDEVVWIPSDDGSPDLNDEHLRFSVVLEAAKEQVQDDTITVEECEPSRTTILNEARFLRVHEAEGLSIEASPDLGDVTIATVIRGTWVKVTEIKVLSEEKVVRARVRTVKTPDGEIEQDVDGWLTIADLDFDRDLAVVEDPATAGPMPALKEVSRKRRTIVEIAETDCPSTCELLLAILSEFWFPVQNTLAFGKNSGQKSMVEMSRFGDSSVHACMRSFAWCPGVSSFLGLVFFCSLAYVGCMQFPPTIVSNFSDFAKTDVPTSLFHEVFAQCLKSRGSAATRRLRSESPAISKDLAVVYMLREHGSLTGKVFNDVALEGIAKFEARLRNLPAWQNICDDVEEDNQVLCNPGISFINFLRTGTNTLSLDYRAGRGTEIPIQSAVLLMKEAAADKIVLPRDIDLNSVPPSAEALRSLFRFRIKAYSIDTPAHQRARSVRQAENKWISLLQEVLPVLQEGPLASENQANDGGDDPEPLLRVYYDGSDVERREVIEALQDDMVFAIIAASLLLVYVTMHVQSLMLSFLGILIVLLSLPLAYVIVSLFVGGGEIGVASFLAIFLVVGFGCDVLFIYTDYWRDSQEKFTHQKEDSRTRTARISWTAKKAGAAAAATTAVTAISFLANIGSSIRALRQFGLFMGLCVFFTFVLVSTVYAPLCAADDKLYSAMGFKWRISPKLRKQCMNSYALHVQRCKWFLCVPAVLLCVPMVVGIVYYIQPKSEVTSLFPSDHPRNQWPAANARFEPEDEVFGKTWSMPRWRSWQVCPSPPVSFSQCRFARCESVAENVAFSSTITTFSCPCYRKKEHSCSSNPVVWIGGLVHFDTNSFDTPENHNVLRNAIENNANDDAYDYAPYNYGFPPVVLTEWKSGRTSSMHTHQYSLKKGVDGCTEYEMCFCSRYYCQMPSEAGWTRSKDLQVPSSVLVDSSSSNVRRLSSLYQEVVSVVVGIDVDTSVTWLKNVDLEELWSFSGIDFSDPWVQRDVLDFCNALQNPAVIVKLHVVVSQCWIRKLASEQVRFPVNPWFFDEAAAQSGAASDITVWFSEGKVKAMALVAGVDYGISTGLSKRRALYDEFTQFVRGSRRGMFHTSRLWTDLDQFEEIIKGSIIAMSVLAVLVTVVIILFTGSLALCIFIVAALLMIAIMMSFVVVVCFQWEVGVVEGVAFVYFMGYSLTYVLHVAHVYADSDAVCVLSAGEFQCKKELRLARVAHALTNIGFATAGSGVTTSITGFFMLWCQLQIFKRLGAICLVVTFLSWFTAFVVLPAALFACGPTRPGHNRWRRCCERERKKTYARSSIRAVSFYGEPERWKSARDSTFNQERWISTCDSTINSPSPKEGVSFAYPAQTGADMPENSNNAETSN